jgi:hypothetical protein
MHAKLVALVCGLMLAAAAPALALADTPNSQLNVGTNGIFYAKNLLLYQKSGSALYCRAVWGQSFVRLTVLVSTAASSTRLTKEHGGAATLDDLQAGDYLDVQGTLETGADSLLVDALSINDHALTVEPKFVAGIVRSVGDGIFALTDKKLGAITVAAGTSTITKGARTIGAGELKPGDKVLSATGNYDFSTKTFAASSVTVWQDPSVFVPRTFAGKVTGIAGTSLPATITVSSGAADYQVFLTASTKIISKSGTAVDLSRFAVGDSVRLFGAIRKDNLANLDATVLRDLNF